MKRWNLVLALAAMAAASAWLAVGVGGDDDCQGAPAAFFFVGAGHSHRYPVADEGPELGLRTGARIGARGPAASEAR